MIISGEQDHVVNQDLWGAARDFHRPTVIHRWIPSAGHFPWIERPELVRAALRDLAALIGT
jgi:pimeloyl-ACP methyl ester carboxylesterase